MNKTLALAASFTAISLLAGCASTGAPSVPVGDRSYSSDNSRAYNLAQAAGLHEARDTKLEAGEYGSMMSDLSGGAGTALSLSNSAGLGLSNGASLGLGLASALFAGPGMMGRDSAFAFVPENEASSPTDATQVIRGHFREAAQHAADNSQFDLEVLDEALDLRLDRYRNMIALRFTNESLGCMTEANATSNNDICGAALYYPAQGSTLRETPLAARDVASGQSYIYLASDSKYALQVYVKFSDRLENELGPEETNLLKNKLLSLISEDMPEWFFIYDSGDETFPPRVLNKGSSELFVSES